jgi:hypothetical protein
MRLTAIFMPLLALSCTPFTYQTIPRETVTGKCMSFERTDGEGEPITFTFALPRDGYLDVKWTFSYFSFDSPALSEAIIADSEGNAIFEAVVDGGALTRIDHGFFDETAEGVIPRFDIHDQSFPSEYDPEMEPYLRSTEDIPAGDPRIREIASRMKTGNMIETMYRIIAFFDGIEYDYNFFDMQRASGAVEGIYLGEKSLWRDPFEVLDDRAGVCTEKAPLAAAIFRACSIPARVVYSAAHAWNEVYLPRDGWVPVDFSEPDRQKNSSFPIEPWEVSNYASVTAFGGSGLPICRLLRDWDKEMRGYLRYYPSIFELKEGASITECFDERNAFFSNMKYIVVHPLGSADIASGEGHYIDFFDAGTRCLLYRQNGDCVLKMADGSASTIDFSGAMTIPVAGIPMRFQFSEYGGFIVIKRS